MSNFGQLISRLERAELAKESFQSQVASSVFEEQRDILIAAYCAMIRLHYEIRRRNSALPTFKPFVLEKKRDDEDPDWCNAAVHILTIADQSVQRFFLISDMQIKSKMTQAVIDDQGMCRTDGFFVELPPL